MYKRQAKHQAFTPSAKRGKLFPEKKIIVLHGDRCAEKGLARRGQRKPFALIVKKLHAIALLKMPDMLRNGRLRDMQFLRSPCLLYTSDAADDLLCVDLGGRRIMKKKKKKTPS